MESRETRVEKIRKFFKIVVSGRQLCRWYRKQDLRYKRMKYKIECIWSNDEKLELQQKFAIKLAGHWQLGHEILFLDESSIQQWRQGPKTWMKRDQEIFLDLAPYRGKSVKFIGAISSNQPHFKYMVVDQSEDEDKKDADHFLDFLK